MADFGRGIDCVTDLPVRFTAATGVRNLACCLARRLQTRRGTLDHAPNDGIDVREWVNAALDANELSRIAREVQLEVAKDERVDDVRVTAESNSTAESLTLTIYVQTANGPFTLTLNVDDVTVDILGAQ